MLLMTSSHKELYQLDVFMMCDVCPILELSSSTLERTKFMPSLLLLLVFYLVCKKQSAEMTVDTAKQSPHAHALMVIGSLACRLPDWILDSS